MLRYWCILVIGIYYLGTHFGAVFWHTLAYLDYQGTAAIVWIFLLKIPSLFTAGIVSGLLSFNLISS
jgi:hypothetical protein